MIRPKHCLRIYRAAYLSVRHCAARASAGKQKEHLPAGNTRLSVCVFFPKRRAAQANRCNVSEYPCRTADCLRNRGGYRCCRYDGGRVRHSHCAGPPNFAKYGAENPAHHRALPRPHSLPLPQAWSFTSVRGGAVFRVLQKRIAMKKPATGEVLPSGTLPKYHHRFFKGSFKFVQKPFKLCTQVPAIISLVIKKHSREASRDYPLRLGPCQSSRSVKARQQTRLQRHYI